MKTASVRELRNQASELLQGKEYVLVTRHGKPTGMLFPLGNPKLLSMELRRKVYLELSGKIAKQLQAKGITEAEIQRDFEDFKKRRRGR